MEAQPEAQQCLQELEAAGRIMMENVRQISFEDRRDAQEIFMNFRTTEHPYSICRYLLDNSKVDFVLFETVVTLRNALIRDWDMLTPAEKNELRQYLLQFIVRDGNVASFVREKMLQVIAIMIKRDSVEDGGQERSGILDEVEKLIIDGDLTKQILGCSIISALMLEYSTTIKSTDVGLTWESHYAAKKQFELTDLRRIFIFSTRALNEIKNFPQPLSSDVLAVLKHLLKISESVLVWGFVSTNMPKYLVGMFEGIYNSENSPTLKVGSDWKDIITNPNTVDLYFHMYYMVKDDPEFSHHSLNCLVQLSSVGGNIWTDANEKNKYMKNYLKNFLKLVTPDTIAAYESIGISTIIKRIINGCTAANFNQFNPDLVKRFLEYTTLITCHFAEGAASEENLELDDKMFVEAFNNILRPWVTILANNNQCFPEEICKSASIQIFDIFMKCHLSPPTGSKTNYETVTNEHEESDRVSCKEQLQYIGIFGRFVPEHTLPSLVNALEGKIDELKALIEIAHRGVNIEPFKKKIYSLHDDIHWLFLVAGNLLTVDSEGEPSMIPSEIMRHSIKKSKKVNINLSLKFLTNQMFVTGTPGSEETVDDVIKILSIFFHFCELEKQLKGANMEYLCSPYLGCTLVWTLNQFSLAYLMPNETYYNELSMPLLQTFGQHTEAANWVLNFLLNKIEFNIRSQLYGDLDLAEHTIDFLVSLVEIRHKAEVVIKCEGFWKLFQLLDDGHKERMYPEVKEGLYKAFALAADPLMGNEQNEYWERVVNPTLETFRNIVSNENFRTAYNDENIRNEIIDTLHKCIGLVSGAVINTTHTIFDMLYSTLSDFASLMGVYHNYQNIVHLIIRLYNEFAKRMLCFLKAEECDKFFASCYKMVDMYACYNSNRVSLDHDAEEQSFRDLYVFLELLMQVMSKEVLDLSSDGRANTGKTSGDVCVYGLKVILPFMTPSFLNVPILCSQYFKCVVFMGEMVPAQLCFDDPDVYRSVLETIDLGLTSYGPEITVLSSDFLQTVASYLFQQEHHEYLDACLKLNPFLKHLMDLVMSSQISIDAISSTANALFTLASCFPDLFMSYTRRLVIQQNDNILSRRLQNAFNMLTHNIEFNGTHLMKCRFKKNFDAFVTNIRGFMFVK